MKNGWLLSTQTLCLNPYSTGNEVVGTSSTCSRTHRRSLNPYSTGNEVVGIPAAFISLIFEINCLNPYSTGNEVVGNRCVR